MMRTFKQFTTEYTMQTLAWDVAALTVMFTEKYACNQKLINTILDSLYETKEKDVGNDLEVQLRLEIDHFDVVVETAKALAPDQTPRGMLENIVKWLANNGTNPTKGLVGNGVRRYEMIMKKLER